MPGDTSSRITNLWKKLQSKAYRRAFAGAQLSSTIAAQIAALREARGWTQKRLADEAGMAQSRICLLEDPDYARMTLTTLRRVAEAFDVVLSVRFMPFSEHVSWTTNLTPEALAPVGFSQDRRPDAANLSLRVGLYSDAPPIADDRQLRPLVGGERRSFQLSLGERSHADA